MPPLAIESLETRLIFWCHKTLIYPCCLKIFMCLFKGGISIFYIKLCQSRSWTGEKNRDSPMFRRASTTNRILIDSIVYLLSNFQYSACYEKYLRDKKHNSFHLARKYSRIFALDITCFSHARRKRQIY